MQTNISFYGLLAVVVYVIFQKYFAEPVVTRLKKLTHRLRIEMELDIITWIHSKKRAGGHTHQFPTINVCPDGQCKRVV